MMQRTLSGPLLAQDLGGGLWQLTDSAAAVQVYLKVPPDASGAVLKNRITRLDMQWHDHGVTLHVTGDAGPLLLESGTVIVHEAKNQLYDALPLAGFDAPARRFWKRVFWLIRIPGGRYVLRLIARRRR